MLYNIPCIIHLFLYTPALLFGQINPLFYNIFFIVSRKNFFILFFFIFYIVKNILFFYMHIYLSRKKLFFILFI